MNKSESKGYGNYGSKTRKAYETYGKEYYSGLSLVERMGGVEYDALSPKTLAWWERIISTDKTFIFVWVVPDVNWQIVNINFS